MKKNKQDFSAKKLLAEKFSKFLENKKPFAFFLGILGVIINIIFFQSTNSPVLAAFIIYWLIIGAIYKISENFFFLLALICLILTVVPFLLSNATLAERFSVWEYLFIVLGLWQYFYLEIAHKYFEK